jgi:predicted amidophosphoribosyltransferase
MLSGHRCRKCGEIQRDEQYDTCWPCGFEKQLQYIDGCIFFGYYDQDNKSTTLSKELLNFKSNSEYGEELSELLEIAYKQKHIPLDFLIPVPPRKGRETEFNPATILSQKFGEKIGIATIEVLYFNRETRKMSEIKLKEERKKNVDGAISFIPGTPLSGKIIGIVDDIFTEGSTVNECAKIIKQEGVKYTYGLCVGRSVPGYEREYLC